MRLDPKRRTTQLLEVALRLAAAHGWRALTREDIALAAGVSPGLVSLHLGTMDAMRRSVMRAAVRGNVVRVVAEGLVEGDPHARRASPELKARAGAWVQRT